MNTSKSKLCFKNNIVYGRFVKSIHVGLEENPCFSSRVVYLHFVYCQVDKIYSTISSATYSSANSSKTKNV